MQVTCVDLSVDWNPRVRVVEPVCACGWGWFVLAEVSSYVLKSRGVSTYFPPFSQEML